MELTPDAIERGFVGFYEWMAANHPEEVDSVIDYTNGWDVNLSPESLSLLERWAEEYVASVGA